MAEESKKERYGYFDACDNAFRLNLDTWELKILKADGNGGVEVKNPTDYERAIFVRHRVDCNVISEEIAYALALNPALSY